MKKRIMALLLVMLMVFSFTPRMAEKVYAAVNDISLSNVALHNDNSLSTFTINYSWQGSSGKMAFVLLDNKIVLPEGSGTFYEYFALNEGRKKSSYEASLSYIEEEFKCKKKIGFGEKFDTYSTTQSPTPSAQDPIKIDLNEGELPVQDGKLYLYEWRENKDLKAYFPDALVAVFEFTDDGFTYAPGSGSPVKYHTYKVTVTPESNMIKTTDSGNASQDVAVSKAMKAVVYTADEGYYFPTDYSVAEVNGIKVTRDSYTQITVSGKPTADDTSITLTAPTAKGAQTIAAENVTATYGDTDKRVNASVSEPTTGGGAISYAVKEGSEDYIGVDAANGTLTIKKVPADGKAYVIATAAGNNNYLEATKEVTVTIAKKEVTVSGIKANDKVYDGNTNATLNYDNAAVDGIVSSDDVACSPTAAGTFSDKNVGDGKTVSISGLTLTGNDAANYELTSQFASTTANITAKEVTVSGITAEDKVYDGNTDAALNYDDVGINGIVDGDDLSVSATGTFEDEKAGTDKKVTISDLALAGDSASNYKLAAEEQQTETKATITHKYEKVAEVPATCTEAGKKQHWKDEEGTVYKDAEGKEAVTETDLVIDALNHDWEEPTYEWKEDNSAVTATRVCKNDASHVETETVETTSKITKDATETEEGETTYTATFKNPAFTEQTKTESIPKLEPEEEATYSNTKGNGTQWTKGSTSTADFTFKRSKNDSETFSHFTGIQVDGKDVAASNYTAGSGSVIVKLKPSYLETLSVGEHTLTALFDDGNKASAKFTVVAKKASGNSNTTKYTAKKANAVRSTSAPKTGDTSNMLLWVTILCASILVLFNVINVRGKRGFGNRR